MASSHLSVSVDSNIGTTSCCSGVSAVAGGCMGSAKMLNDHHDHMATRTVADVVEEGGGRRMDQLEQLRHAPRKIALSRESIPIF